MSKTSSYRESLIESLCDPDEAREYLRAVLEDYPEGFLKALRNVAQANQMSKVASDAGIQRESLYRALSDSGNPRYDTLISILDALGMKLTIAVSETEKIEEKPLPVIEKIPPITHRKSDEKPDELLVGSNKDYLSGGFDSLMGQGLGLTHGNIWDSGANSACSLTR